MANFPVDLQTGMLMLQAQRVLAGGKPAELSKLLLHLYGDAAKPLADAISRGDDIVDALKSEGMKALQAKQQQPVTCYVCCPYCEGKFMTKL